MSLFFAIILKVEMQSNRKLCWIYHKLREARRGVSFSRALLKDGNSSRPQPKAVLSPVSYRSSRRRRQRKRLLLKVPNLYVYVTGKGVLNDSQKRAPLFHVAGMEVQEIYFTLVEEGTCAIFLEILNVVDPYISSRRRASHSIGTCSANSRGD